MFKLFRKNKQIEPIVIDSVACTIEDIYETINNEEFNPYDPKYELDITKELRCLAAQVKPVRPEPAIHFSLELPKRNDLQVSSHNSSGSNTEKVPEELTVPVSQSDEYYDSEKIHSLMKSVLTGTMTADISKQLKDIIHKTFVEKLTEYVVASGEKDSDIYSRAGIDRRLYSKIMSNREYNPSKDTCIMLCIALKLDREETADLIARCGYILSHSNMRDITLEYFIDTKQYNLNLLNQVLNRMGLKMLGNFPD